MTIAYAGRANRYALMVDPVQVFNWFGTEAAIYTVH